MNITRIIQIVDTRTYELIEVRWKPIPGSGDLASCDRCRRTHEVHATVEIEVDGRIEKRVVGTGCAGKESMRLASRFKSGATTAKTIARLRATIARLEALKARVDDLHAAADLDPVPECRIERCEWTGDLIVVCGTEADGHWLGPSRVARRDHRDAEALAAGRIPSHMAEMARDHWRRDHRDKARGDIDPNDSRGSIGLYRDRLAQAEARLADIMGGE